MKTVNNNNLEQQTSDIMWQDRVIATATVTDLGHDKYYKLVLTFPDGSYREFYPSFRTLEQDKLKKAGG